jgi:hypothetical protein
MSDQMEEAAGISQPDGDIISMTKRGCARFMRMFPADARDLFQEGAQAACIAQERGLEGGAMMTYITGACKRFLTTRGVMHNHVGEAMVGVAFIDNYESRSLLGEDDWDKYLDDLVETFLDHSQRGRMIEQDRQIMRAICDGYEYKEIAEMVGRTEINVKKRVAAIKEYVRKRKIDRKINRLREGTRAHSTDIP